MWSFPAFYFGGFAFAMSYVARGRGHWRLLLGWNATFLGRSRGLCAHGTLVRRAMVTLAVYGAGDRCRSSLPMRHGRTQYGSRTAHRS